MIAEGVKSLDKIPVTRIESIGFTVSDLNRAIDFYTNILSFEKIFETETGGVEVENLTGVCGAKIRVVRLRLNNEILELTEYQNSQGRAIPTTSHSNDYWFQHLAIVVSDIEKAFQNLRRHKVRFVSNAPQTLPEYLKQAAGIKAFYFQDNDCHNLELVEFPPDKISGKWRELSKNENELFLGIDHTAIVVEVTEKSLEFYCGCLQMKISGESENYGTEQENLTNVRDARVRITSLETPQAGIGVELLQYLSPTDGKAFPKDTQPNDLWHWQTSFKTAAIDDSKRILRKRSSDFISDKIAAPENASPDFGKAFLVRDADGHAVRFIE